MRMLPVSLNDLKGKNEGIHQRISDILRKHFFFFLVIQSNSVQKCRKTHDRFAVYYTKLILELIEHFFFIV